MYLSFIYLVLLIVNSNFFAKGHRLFAIVITREEIESNDDVGDENICSVGSQYIGYINVPNDVDRFMIFPNVTKTITFNFIKTSGANTILYIYI